MKTYKCSETVFDKQPVSLRTDDNGNVIGACWLEIMELYNKAKSITDITELHNYLTEAWILYSRLFDFFDINVSLFYNKTMVSTDWENIDVIVDDYLFKGIGDDYNLMKSYVFQLPEYQELYVLKESVGLIIDLINRLQ